MRMVFSFFFGRGWTGYVTAVYVQKEPQIAANHAGESEHGSEDPDLLRRFFFMLRFFFIFLFMSAKNTPWQSIRNKKGGGGNVSSPGMTLERSRVFFVSFVEKEFLSAPCF